MGDEDSRSQADLDAFLELEERAQRVERIKSLSNSSLLHFHKLLSDESIIVNVQALELIEAELRSRGLPFNRMQ